ncbi:MAG: DUF120 domain-containing protein [Candidatus Aenigmatarchaeota archaeon]
MSSGDKIALRGRIVPGIGRGKELITKYCERIRSTLLFRPFLGTLNIELEQKIDIRKYETKRIDHILLDGKPFVEARLAPAQVMFEDQTIDCWIFKQEKAPHEDNIIEIVADKEIMEKYKLKEYDEVKVILTESPKDWRGRMKKEPSSIYPDRKYTNMGTFEKGR